MTEVLITTIIPTYKRPLLVKRAIESVLAQTYKNLKVCVYDNASGDETEEVVKELVRRDPRVFYFKNQYNIGALANMLRGFNEVSTPYYSLLSDDDFLLPDFYQRAIDAFDKSPNIGFVCSKTVVIDLIDKKLQFRNQNWLPGVYEPSNEIISKMYASHFVTTGVLMSRKLSNKVGLFDPSGSDNLYMTIAAASLSFAVVDCYGAAVILHQDAYSMIGEGIAKEKAATLCDKFLSTTSGVMKLDIDAEKKVHLLLHVVKLYQQYFDTKKLYYLMNMGNQIEVEDVHITSLITTRGLIIKFYNLFPAKLYKFFAKRLNLMSRIKRIKHKILGDPWAELTDEAFEFVNSRSSDVSKLINYFNLKK